MNYILSLFIATGAIFAALHHLGQGPEKLWDFVAFAMVIGGTIAVGITILPWKLSRPMFRYFRYLWLHWHPSQKHFLEKSLTVIQAHRAGRQVSEFKPNYIEEKILRDGLELIHLGFSSEKIEGILKERLNSHCQVGHKISASIRSLAKYPPAFGLAGTVFGLVELMRAVSAGVPAQETGTKMAIALVATLYGLLVANLLVNPAGEFIKKLVQEEENLGTIAIQTVLLMRENANLLEAQEILNSFVQDHERVNLISQPPSELGELAS